MFSLFSLILATKPEKLELKSFYKHLNDLPNVTYAIQQAKAHINLFEDGAMGFVSIQTVCFVLWVDLYGAWTSLYMFLAGL